MPSEPLCDVCYYLGGGRDMMHSLRARAGDVCTRCHAVAERDVAGTMVHWNRSSALVTMHDALATAEVLCDRCGRSPLRPVPSVGDVCEKCGDVYVQDAQIGTEGYMTPGNVPFHGRLLIPGWRHKTALEVMGEAVNGPKSV